jgi:hypothetical protein
MTTPEVKQEIPLPQEKSETPVSTPETKQEETVENPNWKAVRERLKKEKTEREAIEKLAKEETARANAYAQALDAALDKRGINQPSAQQQYAAYPEEETEDQRIERKVQAAIAQREQVAEKARAEREVQELPAVMQRMYPDYLQVVNEDNGAYLKYHGPDLFESLVNLPQTPENCARIYRMVKKHVPNSIEAKKDELKAENNFNKPRSMSSPTITQSGEPGNNNRLSEERKAENWARMQKEKNRLS